MGETAGRGQVVGLPEIDREHQLQIALVDAFERAAGANERADLALRRAQADAELAIALSKQHDMETKAQATAAKVAKMKAGKPQ